MRALAGQGARPGGLAAGLALTALAAIAFYYRQNWAGQVGGPMSVEKLLWLHFAIVAWFVIPAFLAGHPDLAPGIRGVVRALLGSMLARGVIELWLLYVAFGWSPLYGIAHDVSVIVMVAWLRRRAPPAAAGDGFAAGVARYLTLVQLSLVAEIVFAALFFRMSVHQDAVYFAPPTEAFAHINRLTRWVDLAVYAELVGFLWRQRRPLFGAAPGMATRPA